MTSQIKIKRSGNTASPSALGSGELAYSWATGINKLYIGTGTETGGVAANIDVIGGKYFTDLLDSATSANTANTLVRRDGTGNFSGNLAGNSSTATTWQTARNLSLTGDATATLTGVNGSGNVSAALTLATVNSSVGTYGSSTSVPVVTVNAKGLVTGVTTQTITTAGNFGITADVGSGSITINTDSLGFVGGTGVTTAISGDSVTISIGQEVNTFSNVTFNNLILTGNLTVQGTTTTLNTANLEVKDLNITVAKDATTAAQANGAGLTVAGANATLTYNSTTDRWELNKVLQVSSVVGGLTGNASTASTLETSRSITATGDASWTVNFNGSSNVTAGLTLATVNSNVGSFGSSTSVPTITVNAKGLVTAASSTAIPTATTSVLGLARFETTEFDVVSGLVSIKAVDGGTY